MLKYFSKKTGREINVGDSFTIEGKFEGKFIDMLHNGGFIDMYDVPEASNTITIDKIEEKLKNQTGWSQGALERIMHKLYEVNKAAVLTIVLKKIAVEMDKKYPDHIKNCDVVFSISTVNGKIQTIRKTSDVSFKNFAAFRTYDDAKYAKGLVQNILDDMFDGK